ncbi:DUF2946 family protein [Comamonas flocculans]|uniref:DUF2946 family protein n=1 Tax=Comamonas flocculans TaxID=2597701 RepID=A0A5B8RUN5_9BURK|nr:DUF2946 family protein [Comamonas flocculans]QEA12452.1 DUF2946 family protein [Comamonas flocculans]
MDEIVKRALEKWPEVPHCFGWLGLDARGQWYLRDASVQACGPFPLCRGERLQHQGLLDFIARNYLHDDKGQWFFQNGPQRVYVELEAAPWVWRVGADAQLVSHTGQRTRAGQAICDEHGRLYIATPLGLGLMHSLDVVVAAQLLEQGVWTAPEPVDDSALPARYRFVRSPQQQGIAGMKKPAG